LATRTAAIIQRLNDRELALCVAFNRLGRRRVWLALFAAVSRLGDGMLWYGLALVLPLVYGETGLRAALAMTVVGVACVLTYKAIKRLTGRPRPYTLDRQIFLGTPPLDRYSFPSGHTLHAVAFSITVIWYFPDLAWVLAPFTGLVALSRVVLGLHYPTDVIAGAAIGTGIASAVISLV